MNDDWLDPMECANTQIRIQRVRYQPLDAYPLGDCRPLDFSLHTPSSDLIAEFQPTREMAYHLFWVVCQNFFRIIRLETPLPVELWQSAKDDDDDDNAGGGYQYAHTSKEAAPKPTAPPPSDLTPLNVTDGCHLRPNGSSCLPERDSGSDDEARAYFVDWATGDNRNVTVMANGVDINGEGRLDACGTHTVSNPS